MDFLAIQNAVKSDRFSESKRSDIKDWINARYGRVWAQEAWSFKRILVTSVFATNASSVTLATLGLQRIEAVWSGETNAYGVMLADRLEDFHGNVYTTAGKPYGFTVIGDTLLLDRPVSASTTLTILGEKKFAALAADADVPLIPTEFHYMLVHGAASEGLRLENDPTWQGFEQDYQANLVDMRSSYITSVRTYGDAYPAWP